MKKGLLKRIALSGMTLVILFVMMFYAFPMDVYAYTSIYLVRDHQSPWDDGVPTINEGENVLYLESSSSYCIYDSNGEGWGGFGSNINVPYAGGESSFGVGGKYFNVSQSGYYVITLTDKGNGTWFVSILYSLDQSCTVSDIPDQIYTGSAIEPEITVTADGEKTLTLGTDYEVSYSDNINAGTAKATITGKGNYSGTVEKTFEIVKVDIEPSSITAPTANTGLIYTGSAQELIKAGSVADNTGILYYAVTTENTAPSDNSVYTTTIPTATEAGTYYVWYKVVSDDNHVYSGESACVTVTISKAESSDTGSEETSSGSSDSGSSSSDNGNSSATEETVNNESSDNGSENKTPDSSSDNTANIDTNTNANTDTNTDTNTNANTDTNTNANTDTTAKVQYEEVSISTGAVNDITGTAAATAESNPFGTKIENNSNLSTLLSLSEEEVTQGVNVWLDVQDMSASVSQTDKDLVQGVSSDNTVAMYLDINLFKKVGGNSATKITETNGAVKASILIPESLRKSGRTFEIIRVHNGVATAISGTYDENTHIFTFETDKFSTYALAYKDTAASTDSGEAGTTTASTTPASTTSASTTTTASSNTVTSPKTADTYGAVLLYILFTASLAGMGYAGYFKKRKVNR